MSEICDIEQELGNNPQGIYADVRTRLDILEARINNPFAPAPNADNPFFIGVSGVTVHAGLGDPNIIFALPPPQPGSLFLRQDGYVPDGLYVYRSDGYWHSLGEGPSGNFGPGGGLTPGGVLGYVFVRPINGISDDWVSLSYILQQSVGRNAVVLLPGPNGESFQAKSIISIPNNSLIYGTANTTIVSSLAGQTNSKIPTAPLALPNIVYGSSITLTSDVAIGDITFKTSTVLSVGNQVSFLQSDRQSGNLYTVTNITGPISNVYTVTVDRPFYWSFNHTTDIFQTVTSSPQNIYIFGNGMTVTGTGAALFASTGGQNIHISDLNFNSSGGQPTDGGGAIITCGPQNYHCSFNGIKSVGFSINKGNWLVGTEDVVVEDCSCVQSPLTGAFASFHTTSCANFIFDKCISNNNGLFAFTVDGTCINGAWKNCVATKSQSYGFNAVSITNIQIDNCRSDFNINYGFNFQNTVTNVQISQCFSNNNQFGYQNNGAANVIINNSSAHNCTQGIVGGGIGFTISNIDLSNNNTALAITSSCQITNFTSINGTGLSNDDCISISGVNTSVNINGFYIGSSVSGSKLIAINANANVAVRQGQFSLNNTSISPFFTAGACTLSVSDLTFTGTSVSSCGVFNTNGGTIYIGQNVNVSNTSIGLTWSGTALFIFPGSNGLSYNVKNINANYTVDSANIRDNMLLTSGNAFTIILPPAAVGRVLAIKDAAGNAATQNKTVSPQGGATIDGISSFVLLSNYASVTLVSDGTNWYTTTIPNPINGPAGGDLSGTYPNPTVAGLQGRSVVATAPNSNQLLGWTGTTWSPVDAPTATGAASGDLSGTYPSPTVAKIQGTPVSSSPPTSNQVLSYNGTNWGPTNSFSGIVQIQPIDGTADDSAALLAILTANAYKNAVMLLPGPSGQAFQVKTLFGIPNGTYMIGTPGTKIVSHLVGGAGQIAPLAIPVLSSATALNMHADVPAGSLSFTTTSGALLTVGGYVEFVGTDSTQSTQTFRVDAISAPSGGVYTITIDRPVYNGFFIARSDTLVRVDFLPRDVWIDGKGMTVTTAGTDDWLFTCSGAYNVHIKDIKFDNSGGGAPANLVLFDSASFNCSATGLQASGFSGGTTSGLFLAPVENVYIKDCWFDFANNGGGSPSGYFMLSAINCTFDNCYVTTQNGAPGFVVDGYSHNASLINCTAVNCGAAGFQINAGTNTKLTNCTSDYNTSGFGFYLGPNESVAIVNTGITLTNCSAQFNQYGLNNAGANNVSISNSRFSNNTIDGISGGGSGFMLSNIDTSNNTTHGVNLTSSANISNFTSTNSATGTCLNTGTAGINVTVTGFQFFTTVVGGIAVSWNANSSLTIRNGVFNQNHANSFVFQTISASILSVDNIQTTGSQIGSSGVFEIASGTTVYLGQNCRFNGNFVAGSTNAFYLYLGSGNFIFADTSQQITIVASTYQLDSTSRVDYLVYTDSTSNTISLTLPPPGNYKSRTIIIKDKSGQAGTHNVTILPNGSEKIDGASSYVLNLNFAGITLGCDGTDWQVNAAYNGTVI